MQYKSKAIIFSDLDSTLLLDTHFFSKETKKTVKELYENGIYLIPITARGTTDMLTQAKRLKLDEFGGIACANNGSQIYDFKNNKWILNEYVPREVVEGIYKSEFNKFKAKVNFFGDDTTYVFNEAKNSMYWAQMMQSDYVVAHDVKEIEKPITHLTIILKKETTPEDAKKFLEQLKNKYDKIVNVTPYTQRVIEVAPLNVNKGYAVQKIKEYLNIDNSITTSYAFGDGYNDLPMFEQVTIGVAMENGTQAAKEVADDSTQFNNNENGVAYYINKNILK